MRQRRESESGQSTLEFALTLLFLMGFILFYLQLSLIFAYGNYVHYATFMSARAYLSAGPDRGDQVSRARDVLVRMLKRSSSDSGTDRFPFVAQGYGSGDPPGFQVNPPSQFNATDAALSWMEGVRYTFRSRLFTIPLGAGRSSAAGGNDNSVTLTSESWLGRDPPTDECQAEMGKIGGIYDNGC